MIGAYYTARGTEGLDLLMRRMMATQVAIQAGMPTVFAVIHCMFMFLYTMVSHVVVMGMISLRNDRAFGHSSHMMVMPRHDVVIRFMLACHRLISLI